MDWFKLDLVTQSYAIDDAMHDVFSMKSQCRQCALCIGTILRIGGIGFVFDEPDWLAGQGQAVDSLEYDFTSGY